MCLKIKTQFVHRVRRLWTNLAHIENIMQSIINSRRVIWKDISCSLINLRQPGISSSSSCQISFSINVLLNRSSCVRPTCVLQGTSLCTETSHLQTWTDNARGRTKVRRPESPCGASTVVSKECGERFHHADRREKTNQRAYRDFYNGSTHGYTDKLF